MDGGVSGRLLGLDVGESRVGVAISDPDGRLAVPVRVIARRDLGEDFAPIQELAQQEEAVGIVVGLPLSMSGARGEQAERVSSFAAALEGRLGIPVQLWDERLSTAEAARRTLPARREKRGKAARKAAGQEDALAAAVILQAFLDAGRSRATRDL